MWARLMMGVLAGLGMGCVTEPGGKGSPGTDTDAVDSGPRDSGEPTRPGALSAGEGAVDAGVVPVGCSAMVVASVENTGGADVSITALDVSDPALVLAEAPALPLMLAPGETLAVELVYTPTGEAPTDATLAVTWSGGEPVVVPVTGAGRGRGACLELAVGETTRMDDSWTTDVQTADVMLVLDTTCSMSGFLGGMRDAVPDVLAEVQGIVPDTSFSIATFDDYNYKVGDDQLGEGTDRPFALVLGQTLDPGQVAEAVGSLDIHNGADWPESSLEAMFQAITGTGFDQDCDGEYDPVTDVLPFLAAPGDPFGGTGGQSATGLEVGAVGGTGRRADTLSMVVIGTDADLRDPDAGYAVPGDEDCDPGAVGAAATTAAFLDAGTFLSGLVVDNGGEEVVTEQLTELALSTGSTIDSDAGAVAAVWGWDPDRVASDVAATLQAFSEKGELTNLRADVVVDPDSGIEATVELDTMGATGRGEAVAVSVEVTRVADGPAFVPVEVRLLADIDGRPTVLQRARYYVQ